MTYDDFVAQVEETFGLSEREAANLLESMEEEHGLDLDEVESLEEWGAELADAAFREDDSEYELEDLDDDWLDADTWYEISSTYEEVA